MKLIVVDDRCGRSRTVHISGFACAVLSVCLLSIPTLVGGLAVSHLYDEELDQPLVSKNVVDAWQQQLLDQQDHLTQVQASSDEQLRLLALRVADVQVRMQRLDVVGERLASAAQLDQGEFNFRQTPPVGGPEAVVASDTSADTPDWLLQMQQLEQRLDNRERQLSMLEELMTSRKLADEKFIEGQPVENGWLSSLFGRRVDPFSGQMAWHHGVDIAGKKGSDVVSVAAGVVTWSGDRSGYGLMVEVNHGNGYATRYAHNSGNHVKVGDVVKKGQRVASMGSSGRSTGPHVHFEVYKHGRPVDPASYIRRSGP